MLPRDIDFVIIGAAKSATTWLQIQLQSDPAVYMPDPELHYFSREYARGGAWYLSQFSDEGLDRLVGEKSNSYLSVPEAAARLHRDLPHVKLIAQLRNPVERAYSDYCMLFRRGEVDADIESHLDPSLGTQNRFLVGGHYASQLQRYIDLFGRERVLILYFEGVLDDPETQLGRVRAYLGLPPRPVALQGQVKVKDKNTPIVPPKLQRRFSWLKPVVRPFRGTYPYKAARAMIAREVQYPELTDKLRRRLNEYYGPSIEALEQISGHSLGHWYGPLDRTEQ
jgi:hypothetical protein